MPRISTSEGIARRYLHDEAAERLRRLILDGVLAPRSRVNELELAERFGISRTPLREAIKILATEGLLELLPNRGARVVAISEQELDDMLEIVAGLEGVAAELACRHIESAEIEAIARLHAEMMEAWAARDEARFVDLNKRIHDSIMAASRNAALKQVYETISGRIQRARYTAHKTPEQWQRAADEHGEMIRLLQLRDGEALAALMRRHVRGKRAMIAAAYG